MSNAATASWLIQRERVETTTRSAGWITSVWVKRASWLSVVGSARQGVQLLVRCWPLTNETEAVPTYTCKHHVRDPESTRLRKKYLLSSTSSQLTYNFPATNYRYCTIRKFRNYFFLSCNTFGLVKCEQTHIIFKSMMVRSRPFLNLLEFNLFR